MDEENKNNQPQNGGEPEELKKKLADCEKQCDEYLAGWQRAKADFINYKKEEVGRLEEIAKYGSEVLVADLIGVLDSFDIGLRALENAGPVEKGIYMIRSQLSDVLKRRGAERINVQAGAQFDPSLMEAVAEAESDKPAGTVLEEIEPGWRLYDKILRPSRVKIAKKRQATPSRSATGHTSDK